MGQRTSSPRYHGWVDDARTCTQDNNVSIELLSDAFLGVPVKLRVKRRVNTGIGETIENDYFRTSHSSWWWMSSCDSDGTITLPPVEPEGVGRDGTLLVMYYTNGGYLSKGTPIRSQSFHMRNPLQNFDVSPVETIRTPTSSQLRCTVVLVATAPSARVTLSLDGVRTAWVALDAATRQNTAPGRTSGQAHLHHVTLPLPRVAGTFVVSILSDLMGSSALGTQKITVPESALHVAGEAKHDVFLLAPSSPLHAAEVSVASKACLVQAGTRLRLRCTGTLEVGDAIFLVEPGTSVRRLQTAPRFALDRFTGETIITVPSSDMPSGDHVAVWHAVLGLTHPSGAFLPSARAVIAVTAAADVLPPPPPPPPAPSSTPQASPQPPASTTSIPNDNRFLCVICYDAIAVVKLDPCCHVCFCVTCWDGLVGAGAQQNTCPVCRASVTGHQRIYLM